MTEGTESGSGRNGDQAFRRNFNKMIREVQGGSKDFQDLEAFSEDLKDIWDHHLEGFLKSPEGSKWKGTDFEKEFGPMLDKEPFGAPRADLHTRDSFWEAGLAEGWTTDAEGKLPMPNPDAPEGIDDAWKHEWVSNPTGQSKHQPVRDFTNYLHRLRMEELPEPSAPSIDETKKLLNDKSRSPEFRRRVLSELVGRESRRRNNIRSFLGAIIGRDESQARLREGRTGTYTGWPLRGGHPGTPGNPRRR